MASSRIFIKGLPPTISEDEFKNHFSAKYAITDAKLIPHRRIGYIGYKTPEDAAKAVKYFNRSFIRMSKIGVEIARPVSSFLPLEASANAVRFLILLYLFRGNNNENKNARMYRLERRKRQTQKRSL
jgi:RNA recognition motif-containing protein